MSTIQAKIAAKKCTQETGVSDTLANEMFHRGEGGEWVAIVTLGYLDRTEGLEGKKIVRTAITQLEILNGDAAEHGRQLMRATYLSRQPDPPFDAGENPDDVIQRGKDALLTCQVCLHPLADDTITHDPEVDSPDAYCTWKSDGTEVKAGQDDPAAETSQNPTSDEASDLAGALRESIDKPRRGRKKAEPVGADA